ncbi:MAG TPA: hypothetical protein VM243_19755 [Phycisphaerae bacterium]|nr:hypothetical protein [Phycisphaerae bacterium]
MSGSLLLQTSSSERLEALRRQFSGGGNWSESFLTLLAFAALFALLLMIHRLQQRRQRRDINDPWKLYRQLLKHLGLSAPQREVLRRIAADLRLQHPSVLLLGRTIFNRHATRWQERARHVRRDDLRRIEEIVGKLFARA